MSEMMTGVGFRREDRARGEEGRVGQGGQGSELVEGGSHGGGWSRLIYLE